MPVRRKTRRCRSPLSAAARKNLETGESEDFEGFLFLGTGEWRALWADHREVLLRDWMARAPGTRPWAWWKADAPRAAGDFWRDPPPDPRRQVGGSGRVGNPARCSDEGVPQDWEDVLPADPPQIESEATYLARHDLLTPAECRRVPSEAFDPVTVVTGEADDVDESTTVPRLGSA